MSTFTLQKTLHDLTTTTTTTGTTKEQQNQQLLLLHQKLAHALSSYSPYSQSLHSLSQSLHSQTTTETMPLSGTAPAQGNQGAAAAAAASQNPPPAATSSLVASRVTGFGDSPGETLTPLAAKHSAPHSRHAHTSTTMPTADTSPASPFYYPHPFHVAPSADSDTNDFYTDADPMMMLDDSGSTTDNLWGYTAEPTPGTEDPLQELLTAEFPPALSSPSLSSSMSTTSGLNSAQSLLFDSFGPVSAHPASVDNDDEEPLLIDPLMSLGSESNNWPATNNNNNNNTDDVNALFASLLEQQENVFKQEDSDEAAADQAYLDSTYSSGPSTQQTTNQTTLDIPRITLSPLSPSLYSDFSDDQEDVVESDPDYTPVHKNKNIRRGSISHKRPPARLSAAASPTTTSSSLPSPAPTSIGTFSPRIPLDRAPPNTTTGTLTPGPIILPQHLNLAHMYSGQITLPQLFTLFSPSLTKSARTSNIIKLPEGLDKRFHCPWRDCASSHARRYNLKTHYGEVHEGLKPFACPWCEETFARKYDCNRHRINAHLEEEQSLPVHLQAKLKAGSDIDLNSLTVPLSPSPKRSSSSTFSSASSPAKRRR